MTDEEFLKLVKIKMEETVESIMAFANHIINATNGQYTVSELEMAHHLRLAIIFYRAREHAKEDRVAMGIVGRSDVES